MNISFFKRNPFVFILIPFLLGIYFSSHIGVNSTKLYLCILLIISMLCILAARIKVYQLQWIFGLICLLFLFFAGVLRMSSHYKPFVFDSSKENVYYAKVIQTPIKKPNSYYTRLKITKVKDSIFTEVDVKAIAYLQKSPNIQDIKVNEEIVFSGRLQKVIPNPNPYTFDYATYLLNRHIQYQVYIMEEKLQILKNNKPLYIKMASAKRWQNYFVEKIHSYVKSSKERSILLAMLVGYRAELTPEIKDAFSDSGAMHVLAVSGLHVGILFFLISFIFSPIKKYRVGKWVYVIISMLIIWLYAAITGLSPSVSRAAVMFCVFLIGSLFLYRKSVYNSIAISAFLLLLYEPHLLYYVGFQFSYLAVLSIVFFHPYISKLFITTNKIIHYLWQIISVSISAQLGTFALGIYYFHQFSNMFLLTNLVAINATLVLLGFGFLFLLFSWFPFVAKLLGLVIHYLLVSFNRAIYWIDNIPHSTSENLYISFPQVLIIYSILLLSCLIILFKSKKFIYSILILLLCFVGISSYRKLKSFSQKEIIFYNIKNKTAIQYINGTNAYLMIDSTVNEKDISYNIRDTWLHKGIKNVQKIVFTDTLSFSLPNLYVSKNFLFTKDFKLMFLNNYTLSKLNLPKIDYAVVNSKSKYHYTENVKADKILLGSSLSYYRNKNWKAYLKKKNITYKSMDKTQYLRVKLK